MSFTSSKSPKFSVKTGEKSLLLPAEAEGWGELAGGGGGGETILKKHAKYSVLKRLALGKTILSEPNLLEFYQSLIFPLGGKYQLQHPLAIVHRLRGRK